MVRGGHAHRCVDGWRNSEGWITVYMSEVQRWSNLCMSNSVGGLAASTGMTWAMS